MSYSKFSNRMADYISAEIALDHEKRDVIAYSIENLLLGAGGFALIIVIGFIFHAVVPAVIAAVVGAFLRRVSGGSHSRTPMRCLVSGALAYGLMGVMAHYLSVYVESKLFIFIGLFLCLFLNYRFAPVDCPAKRIHSISLKKKLKIASTSIILFLLLLVSVIDSTEINIALTLGAGFQSMSLIPAFNEGGDQDA